MLKNIENLPLNKYKLTNPIHYYFAYTERQKAEKLDAFRRWGSDINALSKIVVRIKPENWLRSVGTARDNINNKKDLKTNLVPYSLSN